MKLKKLFFCVLLLMISTTVYAKESEIIVNNKNVKMTNEQYQWIIDFYDEEFALNLDEKTFQDLIEKMNRTLINSKEIYSKIDAYLDSEGNVLIGKEEQISKEEYKRGVVSRVSCGVNCWETEYKRLTTSIYTQNGYEYIVSTLVWNKFPTIRSVDVYGLIYSNFRILSREMNMYATFDDNTSISRPVGGTDSLLNYYQSGNQNQNGGWAGLYVLPSKTKTLKSLVFSMESKGSRYNGNTIKANVSYQHSQDNLSLVPVYNQLNYSWSGVGGVFDFGKYDSSYDHMKGLSITG